MSNTRKENPALNRRMKLLREQLDYTHKEMASRIGVSLGAYRKYELGVRLPSFFVVSRMVKEFNLSMDWLYFDKGPMYYEGEKGKIALQEENEQLKEKLRQLQGDLQESARNIEQLTKQLSEKELQLKTRQQELDAVPAMSEDVKELVEQMARDRLLNFEILAHFLRFKNSGTAE